MVLALALLVLALAAYRAWQGRARRELIARVERSDHPLSRAEIDRAGRRFRGDRELLGASLLLAGDAKASDAARWNALLLATAVAPGRVDRGRSGSSTGRTVPLPGCGSSI